MVTAGIDVGSATTKTVLFKPGEGIITSNVISTGAVAKRLRRRWIGIERDDGNAADAEARISSVKPLPKDSLEPLPAKRTEPRVPFGTIVELGIVEPGTRLVDERRRFRAEVRADGTLALAGRDELRGSIHQLGAEVQGKSACNGWTFWHIEAEGKLKPIDDLRRQARQHLGLKSERPVVLVAAE